eukprot:g9219.t1
MKRRNMWTWRIRTKRRSATRKVSIEIHEASRAFDDVPGGKAGLVTQRGVRKGRGRGRGACGAAQRIEGGWGAEAGSAPARSVEVEIQGSG